MPAQRVALGAGETLRHRLTRRQELDLRQYRN